MKTHVMPNVLYCSVTECAYNDHTKCHAGAVTIDGPQPLCGTYFHNSHKGGIADFTGIVGACKNDACIHNESFECTASGIQVSWRGAKPECDTFHLR